jgi:hypothetical protein
MRAVTRTTNAAPSKGGSKRGGNKAISMGTSTGVRVGKKPRRKKYRVKLGIAGTKLGQQRLGESKRHRKSPVRKFFRKK